MPKLRTLTTDVFFLIIWVQGTYVLYSFKQGLCSVIKALELGLSVVKRSRFEFGFCQLLFICTVQLAVYNYPLVVR